MRTLYLQKGNQPLVSWKTLVNLQPDREVRSRRSGALHHRTGHHETPANTLDCLNKHNFRLKNGWVFSTQLGMLISKCLFLSNYRILLPYG
ncbi:hypothetical protein XELAEV_18028133mg [Xenopus laevis]|uniref:Uncharacterized protein n=1 Tax=Xenopus laevis TaxID=8355 RepID=A0A974CZ35_XENLA|nr:hypothetical protein XELAEV_18028133mg [Xenopus laevis]